MVADKTFSILDHIEKLTPAKEKGRYHCPVCGGHNLTINKDGAYQCWNGCECKDIREALVPWDDLASRQSDYPRPIQRRTSKQKSPAPAPLGTRAGSRPALNTPQSSASTSSSSNEGWPTPSCQPIPESDIHLAKLPEPATDIPQKQRRSDLERGEVWVTKYPYSETRWVERTEWLDPTKEKGHAKIIIPYHRDDTGKVVKGKGKQLWPIYRVSEVNEHGTGKWVTWSEGEKCVECSRWLGLVGTTLQGADCNEEAIYRAMLRMKKASVAGVVYLPDHDEAGRKKAEKVAAAAGLAGMPCLIIDPLALWFDMPDSGDIADWVKWGKEQGMNRDDFIQQLEEEIHAAVAARIEAQKLNDPDERLKLELMALLKESDLIKRMRLRGEIASRYRLKASDIQEALKHLEQQTTTPQDTWFTFDDFFNEGTEAIQWVVPQLVPRGETVLLAAQAKCGKTALATDIMYAVLSGGTVIGEQVGVKGKVLLISSDESPNSTRRRMRLRGFDLLSERSNFRIMTHLDITNLAELETLLEDFRPDLVVIDSLTTICSFVGISEKDPEFARYIYKLKTVLGRYNAACVLTHHENKDPLAKGINQVSGSARIPAAVWGILQLKAVNPNNDEDPRRLLKLKPREGEATTLRLQLNPKDTWLCDGIWTCTGELGDESGEKKTQGERVLDLLRQYSPKGLTYQELDNALNIGRSLYQVLDRLEDRYLITKRRSETNNRHWVYAVPKNGGDSPSPCGNPTGGVETAETTELVEFQQFNSQFNTNSTPIQQPSVENEVLNSRNLDATCISTPIQQPDTPEGGEGVVASTAVPAPTPDQSVNEPLKVGDRVVIDCSGSKRHGKTATIKRLKNWGRTQLADLAVDGEGFKYWEAQLSWLKRLN